MLCCPELAVVRDSSRTQDFSKPVPFRSLLLLAPAHFQLFGVRVHVPPFDFERLLLWHPPCLQRPWLWGMRCFVDFSVYSVSCLHQSAPGYYVGGAQPAANVGSNQQLVPVGCTSASTGRGVWSTAKAGKLPKHSFCWGILHFSFKDLKYWEDTSILVVTVNHNFVNLAEFQKKVPFYFLSFSTSFQLSLK